MPSGGARQGTPGTMYPNRSDMRAPKVMAPQAGPSQQYGQAAASIRSQEAVPLVAQGGAPPPPAVANAQPFVPSVQPGGFPPLDRPTERPAEPLTTGAPFGAGAGPEALGLVQSPQTLGALLDKLAAQNPDLAAVAAWANTGRR